jgi:hypothetical protein
MRRTTEAIERDLAALIKHGYDLRHDADELNQTAEESAKKAARLKEDLEKQKRRKK